VSSTYFTWPDGRFRYECRGCGACCKGHGIGIDVKAGQLVQLVAKRPELAAFVRRRGDAITAFNPRDRCWFLRTTGYVASRSKTGVRRSRHRVDCFRSTACFMSARRWSSTSTA
jgi:hypothetical protein